MAKAKTAAAPKAKRKPAKAGAKTALKTKAKGAKKAASNAADALWKLADHPLVGELLAIGATAAVVALAEGGLSGKKKASAKSVKGAGKAAAAAIGARLISEFTDIKKPKAAKPKPAKAKPKVAKAKPATKAKAKPVRARPAAKAKPATG